jgi:hypothetical protein
MKTSRREFETIAQRGHDASRAVGEQNTAGAIEHDDAVMVMLEQIRSKAGFRTRELQAVVYCKRQFDLRENGAEAVDFRRAGGAGGAGPVQG